jgi:manganese oxidase
MFVKKNLTIILTVAMLVSLVFSMAPARVQPVLAASGKTIIYNLYATDGWQTLADGTTLYTYGFVGGRQGEPLVIQKSSHDGKPAGTISLPNGAPSPVPGAMMPQEAQLAGNAQFPAPVIYAAVGDVVEIRLKNLGTTAPNAPNDPHSIHLHGLDVDAANDGVPETSIGAIPVASAADNDADDTSTGQGNVVVYMFSPKYPGSYMYHCHQEADIHVQMGMYGAMIIYNQGDPAAAVGPGKGKGGSLYGWNYDKDYVMLLSEVDTRQHESEENGDVPGFNPTDYKPQYWFINGLSFPNTIHVGLNWNDWIASHPNYDPFIVGSIGLKHADASISNGEKVLVRVINMGFETQPMHMHGFHGKIIGSDGRGWTWANDPTKNPSGTGLEKNTLTIGSGETYDWLIDFGQQSMFTATYPPASNGLPASTYSGGTETRYNANGPVSNVTTADPVIPLPDSTQTYIGGPLVSGAVGLPTQGQLFPFHNHDDYKATNNGVYPGGMFTMIMTIP